MAQARCGLRAAMWNHVGRFARCRGTSAFARTMNTRMKMGTMSRTMSYLVTERPVAGFCEQIIPADRCSGVLGITSSSIGGCGVNEELTSELITSLTQELIELTWTQSGTQRWNLECRRGLGCAEDLSTQLKSEHFAWYIPVSTNEESGGAGRAAFFC
mmetsp:Transcript_53068/g.116438  ORF Transcript_53068/g.116438 Transcript_53068/m.116438 type:complete len:158 (+) Transcript_53068:18-491(+)